MNFNQKRGYYQLRGEEEDDDAGKSVEFYALKYCRWKRLMKRKVGTYGIMCTWKMDGYIEEQVICLLIGLEN